MPTVLEIFKEITKIKRCSPNHNDFIEYIKERSKKLKYICLVDEANNILCKKQNSNAKIVFQSH